MKRTRNVISGRQTDALCRFSVTVTVTKISRNTSDSGSCRLRLQYNLMFGVRPPVLRVLTRLLGCSLIFAI